jgi:lycopene beta-cyclase
MSRIGLKDRRLLIIDQEEKIINDRTWCFWSQGDHPFQDLVFHSWPQVTFADDKGIVRSDMRGYQYHLIRGIDFYQKVKAELKKDPQVTFLTNRIEHIHDIDGGAVVLTDQQSFTTDLVLSSIAQRPTRGPKLNSYNLMQHFRGYWIETAVPQFDDREVRLMDFSIPQEGDCRFMYVLPISPTRALVEYTIFSGALLPEVAYREALEVYIKQALRITDYRVYEEERGIIPMTNMALNRFKGKNILQIGTAGGWVKPSTGYAFQTIQRESEQLAKALLNGHPVPAFKRQDRFKFYDNLLLHILSRPENEGKEIFSALFRNNSIGKILSFLNQRSHIAAEISIFGTLPFGPFLRALWQRTVNKLSKAEKPFFPISEGRIETMRVSGNSEKVF